MKWLPASILLSAGVTLTAAPDRGAEIYKQLCFTCHGPQFEGGIGPALNDGYWQHGSSPAAILDVINNGVEGTEMIGYKDVFPEADRVALRDYILSKQSGFREVVRSYYAKNFFKGKRLTPELFGSTESSAQTPIKENVLWVDRMHDGGVRMQSKLYITKAGKYQFRLKSHGRTAVYIDGQEVYYFDPELPKQQYVQKTIDLKPGVYSMDLLHVSKKRHGWRVSGSLVNLSGGHFQLHGRSLQGNLPKEIHAGTEAKVVRKWIRNLSPRALLCLLPNKVIVAFDPEKGVVTQVWHSAFVNQTPSLPDRSAEPSQINGTPVPGIKSDPPKSFQFLSYQTLSEKVLIHAQVDGKPRTITIAPEGKQSFSIK